MKNHILKMVRLGAIVILLSWSAHSLRAAGVLPEFAYREVTVELNDGEGQPVAGAAVYGFCAELNLVWHPNLDRELTMPNDIWWHESYLGKTGPDGSIKATVPPGHWNFLAAGKEIQGTVVAAWITAHAVATGEIIRLKPEVTEHWILAAADGSPLLPERLFMKPAGYPIWMPLEIAPSAGALQLEMSAGSFDLWAAGRADGNQPGFVMDWGTVSEHTPAGKIFPVTKPALVGRTDGDGPGVLSWFRRENAGLEGTLPFTAGEKILFTPGLFTLAYSRPVGPNLEGSFVGQCYNLREGSPVAFDMGTPLAAGLDQALSKPSKSGKYKLTGQLYLVDGNGHILSGLLDRAGNAVNLGAAVRLNNQRFAATQVLKEIKGTESGEDEEPLVSDADQTKFTAAIGTIHSAADAIWEFTAPPGVLPQTTLSKSAMVTVSSATFQMEVPAAVQRDAQNLLSQAELLAAAMEKASGRRRRVAPTIVTLDPSKLGAVSAHNGSHITIGSTLLFDSRPTANHTFAHELGHNFGFHHGGLHETVVEVSRCEGGDQISAQLSKWMFMNRMNGMMQAETPYKYPNVGLYLYGYSQGGADFLHLMSAHEYTVVAELAKQGYTKDEATAALLSLALHRDMTEICATYGLEVTADRVGLASQAARGLATK